MKFSLHAAIVLVSFATVTNSAEPPKCIFSGVSGCHEGRTANRDDCTKYEECINLGSFFGTELYNCQCPKGFYYAYTACVPGSCKVKPTCQVDPKVTSCNPGRSSTSKDCTKYKECMRLGSFGGTQLSNCQCQPGHYFDPQVGGCIRGQCGDASCEFLGLRTCNIGRLADPNDCEKYTLCTRFNSFVGNIEYSCKCPAEKHFYTHANTCIPGTC